MQVPFLKSVQKNRSSSMGNSKNQKNSFLKKMFTMNEHYAQTNCPKNSKFVLLLLYGSGNMHIKFHVTGPMGLRNIIVKPKKVSKKRCKEFKKKYFGTSNAPILMKFGMKFRERLKFLQKKFRSDSLNC